MSSSNSEDTSSSFGEIPIFPITKVDEVPVPITKVDEVSMPKVDDIPKVDIESLNQLISDISKYRDMMITLSDDQNFSLNEKKDPEFQLIVDSTKLLVQHSAQIEATFKNVHKNFEEITHVTDLIAKYGQYSRFELMKIIHQNNKNAKENIGSELKKLTKLFRNIVIGEVNFERRDLNEKQIRKWFDKIISRDFDQFEFEWKMHKLDQALRRPCFSEIYD